MRELPNTQNGDCIIEENIASIRHHSFLRLECPGLPGRLHCIGWRPDDQQQKNDKTKEDAAQEEADPEIGHVPWVYRED